jgi:glycosyltransferase involved in cell wall biosynthesis
MADAEHPFAPVLREAGYHVILLPGFRSIRGLAAFRQTLREQRPEVVHIHQEGGFDALALISACSPGVRGVVRTVQNSFSFAGLLRMRRKARIALARRLGVVWVACSYEVAATERAYCTADVDAVVENWVDVEGLVREATAERGAAVRDELSITPDERVVVTVGNCSPTKNHELLATALAAVESPVVVLHVGDPAHASGQEHAAWKSLPGRHQVYHLGARGDVGQLLAASDLFAFPSRHEGMPLAAVEAVCAGVPVLAARATGLNWLSAIDSAQLLPLDARAWANALTQTLARGPETEAIRAAATTARVRFSPDLGVSKYVACYQVALRRGIRKWPGSRLPVPMTP